MALTERIPILRERLFEVLSGTDAFFADLEVALAAASPTGDAAWHAETFSILALGVVIGLAAGWFVQRWAKTKTAYLFDAIPTSRRERIGFLILRAGYSLLSVIALTFVGLGLSLAINGDIAASRSTYIAYFSAFSAIGVSNAIYRAFFAPDLPAYRSLALDDAAAKALYRGYVGATAVACLVAATCVWMFKLGLSHDAHFLMLILGSLFSALVFSFVFVRFRKPIAGLIARPGDESVRAWRRLLASSWHVLAVVYFLLTWAIASARILLDLPMAFGLVIGPLVSVLFAAALYGALLIAIDIVVERFGIMTPNDGAIADVVENPFIRLAEQIATFVAWVVGGTTVLRFWGVDVWSHDGPLLQAMDILIIALLGYFAFQLVRISIDRKIEAEGGLTVATPGDEGGAAGGASRLITLLPLLRNFLLITVLVMSVMIVLSQIGIDIAPLFAGAGVVGLAIGFGAQSLIRDIFSGAFFLIDDAFRRGEYIDIGVVKGTVENISLRSLQLRHHLGALHTIPFGEITQMTNYSRDWAMMKLKLRVTYDTDVEKVRKMVKKLGQELMDDPEIGDKFLEPLKSQGVSAMEDSAMILRVKFMTKPGEQFVVRKRVYADLRALFEREGIHFAHKEVTVRLAGDEDGATKEDIEGLSDADKRAIGGAALAAAENNDALGPPKDDR